MIAKVFQKLRRVLIWDTRAKTRGAFMGTGGPPLRGVRLCSKSGAGVRGGLQPGAWILHPAPQAGRVSTQLTTVPTREGQQTLLLEFQGRRGWHFLWPQGGPGSGDPHVQGRDKSSRAMENHARAGQLGGGGAGWGTGFRILCNGLWVP